MFKRCLSVHGHKSLKLSHKIYSFKWQFFYRRKYSSRRNTYLNQKHTQLVLTDVQENVKKTKIRDNAKSDSSPWSWRRQLKFPILENCVTTHRLQTEIHAHRNRNHSNAPMNRWKNYNFILQHLLLWWIDRNLYSNLWHQNPRWD